MKGLSSRSSAMKMGLPLVLGFACLELLLTIGFRAHAQTNTGLQSFVWAPIPPNVQAGRPFSVTLEAKMRDGTIDTNFSGPVNISELVPGAGQPVLITEVRPGITNGVELSNLSPSGVNLSGWRVVFYDSASWPAPKAEFILPSGTFCAAFGTLEIRDSAFFPGSAPVFLSGVTLTWSPYFNNPIAVVLVDGQGNAVDSFCAGTAYAAYISIPASIAGTVWNGPPLGLINGSNLTYGRRGRANHHNAADWQIGASSFGALNPQLELPFITTAAASPAIPPSVTLTNGIWSGQLAVSAPGTNVILRADNGEGVPGDSIPITVFPLPGLDLQLPSAAYKAAPGLVGLGQVSLPQAVATNVQVTLSSSLTNEITVPPSVTIVAGATTATLAVSNFNNGLVEGPQVATVLATAPGFSQATGSVTNYDGTNVTLTVSTPARVLEPSGWLLSGQVTASKAPWSKVAVRLTSSDPAHLVVPDSAIIGAGQTSARFGFAVLDNPWIDGNHPVTISASVPGWTAGQTQVLVIDDETTNLSLAIPYQANEGAGVLSNYGTVQLTGLLLTDLTVSVQSSLPTILQTPSSVLIPAGQSSAQFNVTLPGDSLTDTNQNVLVTASAAGFASAGRSVLVIDNHVKSFSFASLPGSQLAGQPFVVSVTALNTSGSVVPGYSGTVNLDARGANGPAATAPAVIGPFTNGLWSGNVSVMSESHNNVLIADDGLGHQGVSNPFDVFPGRQWNLPVSDFAYDALRHQIQAAVSGSAPANRQSIVALVPATGTIGSSVPIGDEPGPVAISSDDQFLYVSQTSTGGVARVNLSTLAVDLRFTFGPVGTFLYEMAAPPGDPHSVVGWISGNGNQSLALFRDGVQSPATVAPDGYLNDPYNLVFCGSATNFYSLSGVGAGLWLINRTTNGLSYIRTVPAYTGGALTYAGVLLFSTSGGVYDPINVRHLGDYPTNGLVAANPSAGQVYFLSGSTLLIYDLTRFNQVGQIQLPSFASSATKLLSCGTDGVALATPNQVLLVQSGLFPSFPRAGLSVAQFTETNTAVVGSNFTYSIVVSNAGPETATNALLADVLPADSTLVQATNALGAGTFTNGILTCPLGALAPGNARTTTVVIQPSTPGPMVNQTWVIGDGSNLANAISRLTNTVVFGPQLPAVTRLWFSGDDLAYDPVRNFLWASSQRFADALNTSLRAIDLGTGLPANAIPLNYPPRKIAISASARYLFAAYYIRTDISYPGGTYGYYIARGNLQSGTVDLNFSPLDTVGQLQSVVGLVGISSYPDDIVVGATGLNSDVALYENSSAIRRAPYYVGSGLLEVNPSIPTRLYMLTGGYGQDYFTRLNIDSTAISQLPGTDTIALPVSPDNPTTGAICYGNGLLFADTGMVADPEALTNVTRLPTMGSVQTDPSSGLAFYLFQQGSQWTLMAFNISTLAPAWSFVVPGVLGNAAHLTRCAPGILAFRTDANQVFVLNTTQLPHVLQADLAVSQTASTTTAITNVPVTFTTTVNNAGPSPATAMIITNQFPADATILSTSCSQGTTFTNTAGQIRCLAGNLPQGASAWLQVVVTWSRAGFLTNLATVGQNTPDVITSNNLAVTSVQFSIVPVSDLSVHQSAPAGPVLAGSNFVYTVNIINAGPDTAADVQLNDSVITGGTIAAATPSQGTISQSGASAVAVDFGPLTNGATASITLVITPSGGGMFVNQASVSGSSYDPDTSNNQALSAISLANTNGQNLIDEIPIPVADVAYEPSNQWIVASTTATAGPWQNRIVGVSARNGLPAFQTWVGNSLGRVAVSAGGNYAYVGTSDTGGVARVDIPSSSVDLRFAVNSPGAAFGPFVVEDLAIMPGAPQVLAVARGGYGGYSSAVALFDSGVQRPDTIDNLAAYASYFRVAFPSQTNVYTTQPGGFQVAAVGPTGLTSQGSLFTSYSGDFATDGGLVFLTSGTVFDPNTGNLVASFPATGPVVPDLANGRVYFLSGEGSGNYYFHNLVVRAFDWTTRGELWSLRIPTFIGYEQRLIGLGTNGLAFFTDTAQLFVVHTPELAQASTDVSVQQAVSSSSVNLGQMLYYTFTIQNFGPWTASGVVVSNRIPSGLGFISASATQGACSFTNGVLTCFIGSMTNEATVTLTLAASAQTLGSITNTALVMLSNYDACPSNNTASTVITVMPPPPLPSVNIVDAAVAPIGNPTSITFFLSLSGASGTNVSLAYQTSDGTARAGQDYSPASGTITFSPGSTGYILTLPIVLNNPSLSPSSYFFLNLASPTNGMLVRTQAVAMIAHQSFYSVFIANSRIENRGTDTNAAFLLTCWPPQSVQVSVQYQSFDGTAIAGQDYAPRTGTVTFAPGVSNLFIAVPVFGNSVLNTVRSFSVLLSDPENALLSVDEATGTIVDDALVGPLTISKALLQGTNVTILFNSIFGRSYRLERTTTMAPATWTTVLDGIPGTGGLQTVLDTGAVAATPVRFYRLVLLP